MTGEGLGVPSIGVMTSEFIDGAELMATALGLPGYRFAVISHPISSATDAELRAKAEAAAAQAISILQGHILEGDASAS